MFLPVYMSTVLLILRLVVASGSLQAGETRDLCSKRDLEISVAVEKLSGREAPLCSTVEGITQDEACFMRQERIRALGLQRAWSRIEKNRSRPRPWNKSPESSRRGYEG
jgi:hypothetical protein